MGGRAKPGGPWKVVAVSLYERDLELLDLFFEELRSRGHRDVGRSLVVRLALAQLDVEALTSWDVARVQQARHGTPTIGVMRKGEERLGVMRKHVIPALQDLATRPCKRSNCGTVCLCGACHAQKALATLDPTWRP